MGQGKAGQGRAGHLGPGKRKSAGDESFCSAAMQPHLPEGLAGGLAGGLAMGVSKGANQGGGKHLINLCTGKDFIKGGQACHPQNAQHRCSSSSTPELMQCAGTHAAW